jgi:16S rRNA (guanine966-N2)-methyltransferase
VADAGRVIAGTARGVRLAAPGSGTRPMGDRVKQSLFAILEPDLPGRRVLDLFAGSGAAGIEALSRGAASAILVERDPGAVAVIAENLRRAGLSDRATVVRREVAGWLRAGRVASGIGPVDLVVVDPPYDATDLLEATLRLLVDPGGDWLAADAIVAVKSFWRDAPPASVGLLASTASRRFGETAVTVYRRRPPERPQEEA